MRIEGLGLGVRRREDGRPLCRTCARGPGLRAQLATGVFGPWGWPGCVAAPRALWANARVLARVGALPLPLGLFAGLVAAAAPVVAAVALAGVLLAPRELPAALREAQAHAAEGKRLLDAERPAEALAAYWRAIREVPGMPEYRYMAGVCEMRCGRPKAAEGLIREAIEGRKPESDWRYWQDLGEVLIADKRPEAALEPLAEAVRVAGKSLDPHRHYQDAMLRSGRGDDVRAWYAAGAAKRPGDADWLYLVARLEADPALRLQALARALEAAPAHFWAHYATGATLRDLQRFREAARAFAAARDAEPGDPRAWHGVAQCLALAGDLAGAEQALGEFRARFPESRLVAQVQRVVERLRAGQPPVEDDGRGTGGGDGD